MFLDRGSTRFSLELFYREHDSLEHVHITKTRACAENMFREHICGLSTFLGENYFGTEQIGEVPARSMKDKKYLSTCN